GAKHIRAGVFNGGFECALASCRGASAVIGSGKVSWPLTEIEADHMTDPNRIVTTGLAALMVFVVSLLTIGSAAATIRCEGSKDCPRGFHCQPGINPKAPGICVGNWMKEGTCWLNKHVFCPPGFHCGGVNPNAPAV